MALEREAGSDAESRSFFQKWHKELPEPRIRSKKTLFSHFKTLVVSRSYYMHKPYYLIFIFLVWGEDGIGCVPLSRKQGGRQGKR